MNKPVIKVEGLGKRYRIGTPGPVSLRDAIARAVRAPLRTLQAKNGSAKNTIWALRDVNFEVAAGEVVGVIGRNGAGKSTLLKILSRITKPTEGRVALKGRVGSLLEVGTGFHSELTGRENVFLNGAVLGMTRREIERKFDEIVAFAETEAFLDTPVKHYSSGMIVRLAFAVAAHLEPEIMIIDEVLAVGDFAFQKKCLGKMNEVAKHGRTVLFVSHDISAVNALCQRVILLHEGSILKSGPTEEVTRYYLDSSNKLYSPINWVPVNTANGGEIQLNHVAVEQAGEATNVISCRTPFAVVIDYNINRVVRGSRIFLILRNSKGELIFTTSDYDVPKPHAIQRAVGRFVSRIQIPGELLKTGAYFATVGVDVAYERVVFAADDVLHFDVYEPEDDTQATRHGRVGVIAPVLEWETIAQPED
ncbi:MAG TPA: ABC transporter ATP-binding protein [Pyrinomonadaceae bacterium]|jgi:lipopolysaccharide transport system ATP-binding protein